MGPGRLRFTTALLAATLALVACGGSGDGGSGDGGGNDGGGSPGEALSIEEALASTAEGPLLVSGLIVAPEGEAVRLCSALAESYPPQCGGASLVVEGLDLETVPGLTRTTEPDLAQVAWTDTPVAVTGELADGVLTVSTPGV
ncbi:MAG: hypothetical protein IT201_06800 [Thermoleophilia bacterium]|nr:hypothetical protein [Thermoleophilia bacterium]